MKKEKEKRKNVKKMFALMFAVLLTFTGWGCKRTAGPTDTGLEEQTNEGITEETAEEPEIPAGWKEYRNEELGFSFWYPGDMDVHVDITNIDESPEVSDPDNPWLMTKEELSEEQEEINSSPVGRDISLLGDQTARSYYKRIVALTDNLKATSYLGTSEGGGLSASYTFYYRNHRIEIWVSHELPESVYVNGKADNALFNQLLEQIDKERAPEEIQNFFDAFKQSIATLKLID